MQGRLTGYFLEGVEEEAVVVVKNRNIRVELRLPRQALEAAADRR